MRSAPRSHLLADLGTSWNSCGVSRDDTHWGATQMGGWVWWGGCLWGWGGVGDGGWGAGDVIWRAPEGYPEKHTISVPPNLLASSRTRNRVEWKGVVGRGGARERGSHIHSEEKVFQPQERVGLGGWGGGVSSSRQILLFPRACARVPVCSSSHLQHRDKGFREHHNMLETTEHVLLQSSLSHCDG